MVYAVAKNLKVTDKFTEMGLKVLDSDPCCWKLEESGEVVGLICAHVDEFRFTGSPTSAAWLACRERIKKVFFSLGRTESR